MAERSLFFAIPYIVLFAFLLFLYYLENKAIILNANSENNSPSLNRIRSLGFIVLLVFIGLRGHVYTDFVQYYWLFDRIPDIRRLDIKEFNMESGFIIYTSLFKTIVPNYFAWVFINTVIDLTVIFHFFKKNTQSVILAFIVFIAFQGLYVEFNLYRNSKAIILFLLSIPYMLQRKSLPYFALNILGFFFHIGSLLFLPLYFFCHKPWSRKIIWGLFILVNLCFFFQIHFTSEILKYLSGLSSEYLAFKANKYADYSESYGLSFGYIEKTFIILLILLKYQKLYNSRPINSLLCNCSILFYFITYFFADISILTERLSYLFVFSFWIVIPQLITLYGRKSIMSKAILLLLFLRLVVSNMTILCYYDNLLWGIMDINKRSSIVSSF